MCTQGQGMHGIACLGGHSAAAPPSSHSWFLPAPPPPPPPAAGPHLDPLCAGPDPRLGLPCDLLRAVLQAWWCVMCVGLCVWCVLASVCMCMLGRGRAEGAAHRTGGHAHDPPNQQHAQLLLGYLACCQLPLEQMTWPYNSGEAVGPTFLEVGGLIDDELPRLPVGSTAPVWGQGPVAMWLFSC
jgi:hypothetical protein